MNVQAPEEQQGLKYTHGFPSNTSPPLHRNRPKAVKNIRKIRAISYVLTEKPHTNQDYGKGLKGGRLKGQGDVKCWEQSPPHFMY